ncbi:cytochrome b6f subunit family protein [Hydrocoleum sp. CS-953]
MVDGSGIGYWVEFEEKMGTWFFEDEIEPAS